VEVIWTAAAEADLRQIHAYVASDNPAAAQALADAIVVAANSLGAFPLKGHPGANGTREWVVPRFRRYLLIYDVDAVAGKVRIVAVWHQSRHR
jgi:plasmid stabilization system protein ParE